MKDHGVRSKNFLRKRSCLVFKVRENCVAQDMVYLDVYSAGAIKKLYSILDGMFGKCLLNPVV